MLLQLDLGSRGMKIVVQGKKSEIETDVKFKDRHRRAICPGSKS
jgi:hypothetical protein